MPLVLTAYGTCLACGERRSCAKKEIFGKRKAIIIIIHRKGNSCLCQLKYLHVYPLLTIIRILEGALRMVQVVQEKNVDAFVNYIY